MHISRAPLRISFFGGGTDYPDHFLKHGGAVLASGIDKFIYNTVNSFPSHLFDYSLRLSYRQVELIKKVDDIEHKVYQACLRRMNITSDIELHTFADLPAFTGLGSSSSFTVSLLKALHAYKGLYYSPMEIAYQAIDIEQNVLNENVGCQDQVMAALGGFNYVEFRKTDDIVFYKVPIKSDTLRDLEDSLFLVFTKIKRSADAIASKQIEKLPQNKELLFKMRDIADKGYSVLCDNAPLSNFGELLHQSWLMKRSLEESISNKEIDAIYNYGLESGALGGKLLGAGGGGFVLFFVPEENRPKFKENFKNFDLMQPKLNASRSEVVFSS